MNKGVNFYVECNLEDRQVYFTLDKDFRWLMITDKKEDVISKTSWLSEVYILLKDIVRPEQLLFLFDLDLRYNLSLYDTELYFLVQQKYKCRKYYAYYLNRLADILELSLDTIFAVSLPRIKFTKVDYSSMLSRRKVKLEELSGIEELYQDSINKSVFYMSRSRIITIFGSMLKIKEWYEVDLTSLDKKLLSYYHEIIKMVISIS